MFILFPTIPTPKSSLHCPTPWSAQTPAQLPILHKEPKGAAPNHPMRNTDPCSSHSRQDTLVCFLCVSRACQANQRGPVTHCYLPRKVAGRLSLWGPWKKSFTWVHSLGICNLLCKYLLGVSLDLRVREGCWAMEACCSGFLCWANTSQLSDTLNCVNHKINNGPKIKDQIGHCRVSNNTQTPFLGGR